MRRIGVPPGPWTVVPDNRQREMATVLDAEGQSIGTFDRETANYIASLENQHRTKPSTRTFSNDTRLVDKCRAVSPSIHRKRF